MLLCRLVFVLALVTLTNAISVSMHGKNVKPHPHSHHHVAKAHQRDLEEDGHAKGHSHSHHHHQHVVTKPNDHDLEEDDDLAMTDQQSLPSVASSSASGVGGALTFNKGLVKVVDDDAANTVIGGVGGALVGSLIGGIYAGVKQPKLETAGAELLSTVKTFEDADKSVCQTSEFASDVVTSAKKQCGSYDKRVLKEAKLMDEKESQKISEALRVKLFTNKELVPTHLQEKWEQLWAKFSGFEPTDEATVGEQIIAQSFTKPLRELSVSAGGISGSVVLTSNDNRWIVKSAKVNLENTDEVAIFSDKKFQNNYVEFMIANNARSTLPRFLGVVDVGEWVLGGRYWFVLTNVFPKLNTDDHHVVSAFDFKPIAKYHIFSEFMTKERLCGEFPETEAKLDKFKQDLFNDAKFFRAMQVSGSPLIDYSFLVMKVLHKNAFDITPGRTYTISGGTRSDGTHVSYFIGVIDILTDKTTGRRFESAVKRKEGMVEKKFKEFTSQYESMAHALTDDYALKVVATIVVEDKQAGDAFAAIDSLDKAAPVMDYLTCLFQDFHEKAPSFDQRVKTMDNSFGWLSRSMEEDISGWLSRGSEESTKPASLTSTRKFRTTMTDEEQERLEALADDGESFDED